MVRGSTVVVRKLVGGPLGTVLRSNRIRTTVVNSQLTVFLGLYSEDGSVRSWLHCEGYNGAMVDVVRVERANCNLLYCSTGSVLKHSPCGIFSNVETILSDDSIDFGGRRCVPG